MKISKPAPRRRGAKLLIFSPMLADLSAVSREFWNGEELFMDRLAFSENSDIADMPAKKRMHTTTIVVTPPAALIQ